MAEGDLVGGSGEFGMGRGAEALQREMAELRRSMALTSGEVGALSRGISGGLRGALDDLVKDGAKLSDVLRGIGQSIADTAFRVATRPVTDALGSALGQGVGALLSGGFAQERVMPFAKGGVLSGPVRFPMRGGIGLAGEAGPEAIMPLARGADGRLGVAAAGGGRSVNVVFHINTPDPDGFRRSQPQIAAQLRRALAHGERNL